MRKFREQAETTTSALLRILSGPSGQIDVRAVADLIEQTLYEAAREQEKRELQRIAEVQESAHAHLSRLLNASPAVIYCRVASGDFEPTFVSESIHRLFGCTPREYLADPYLWRDRVHPDDVARIVQHAEKVLDDGIRYEAKHRSRSDMTVGCGIDVIVVDAKGPPRRQPAGKAARAHERDCADLPWAQ